MGKANLKFRVYVRSFRYIVSGPAGSNHLLFTAWIHEERNRHRERKKNIYYEFRRFGIYTQYLSY